MDRRERRQVARIERCLITMSGLGPSNPADVRAIVEAWRTGTVAANELWQAIECLRTGRWHEADAHLNNAEEQLKPEEAVRDESYRREPRPVGLPNTRGLNDRPAVLGSRPGLEPGSRPPSAPHTRDPEPSP